MKYFIPNCVKIRNLPGVSCPLSVLALLGVVSLVRTAERCDAAEDEDGGEEEPLDQEETEGEHHGSLLTEIL